MRRTIAEELRHHVATHGHEEFVRVGDGPPLSYAELEVRASAVGGGLQRLGVMKGDRVAVLCTNRQEAIELVFACAFIGAVEVPLNYHLRGEFLKYQIQDAEPTVVVVDGPGYAMLVESGVALNSFAVVLLDDDPRISDARAAAYPELASGEACARANVTLSDVSSILYTSGTTGLPKGCMLTHGYMTASAAVLGSVGWMQPGDRVMTAFPHFHASFHMNVLMSALVNGACVLYEPQFHASAFMRRARENRATVVWGLGAMGVAILAQPTRQDDRVETLRLSIWSGLHLDDQPRFEERFGGQMCCEVYGQTEVNPIAISSVDDPDRKPGTLGHISELYEIAIVDSEDRPVEPGAVGEIVVRPRGPHMMFAGYWRRPEETLHTMRNLWHHTGDLVRLDEGSRVVFVDRKKDAVRRRGENVSCFELETAIARHPEIAVVAVSAIPSPMGDDDIKVSIVPRTGGDIPLEGLFEFFQSTLPYYAVPRYVEFRDALPMTATGRVRKEQLREEGVHNGLMDLESLGLVVPRDARRDSGRKSASG